ncbi:hypothetical protein NIA69_01380 [Gemmiger formicilis]|nr:hypothetical protein [Gemmiger formicilis]
MSRRNTISREFFATIAAVLVLGLSVMCAIQAALSAAYFIGERKSSLTDVLNGATALSERFADEGSIVTKPLQGRMCWNAPTAGLSCSTRPPVRWCSSPTRTARSCCIRGRRLYRCRRARVLH